MDRFLGLPCAKMFMYGEQNATLTYLRHIEAQGVQLCEVPHCGHFPMYSNPTVMWTAIARILSARRADA
jgi:pimeloyl-ACP methyl ester carboxylesterase